jgi:hypothetical protein
MYLVLVTTKASNILEDLEALRLLGKVVPDFVQPLDEAAAAAAAFDLIAAFDEVLTVGGLKENVTAGQVAQNCAMESHEEKLHRMIVSSKVAETKDLMKRKAADIDRARVDAARGGGGGGSGGVSSGMGGARGGGGGGYGAPSGAGMVGGGGGGAFARAEPAASLGFAPAPAAGGGGAAAPGGKRSMQLGGRRAGGAALEASLRAEGEAVEAAPAAGAAAAAPPPVAHTEPVFLAAEERVSAALNRDGGLESMEVTGTLSLSALPDADARVRVALRSGDVAGFQFKTHPNIDKALFAADNVLGLKDAGRPFPPGAPLGVLKWRLQTADEARLPLTINCWPSLSGAQSYVNIEYECAAPFDLRHVSIAVPLPALAAPPAVNSIDGGEWRYDARKSTWIWEIELVDASNRSGSAEIVVPASDPGAFFPIAVAFSAARTLCDVEVAGVAAAEGGAPVRFGASATLATDSYVVE